MFHTQICYVYIYIFHLPTLVARRQYLCTLYKILHSLFQFPSQEFAIQNQSSICLWSSSFTVSLLLILMYIPFICSYTQNFRSLFTIFILDLAPLFFVVVSVFV